MNFTGERVIPGEADVDLFNEHWARYLFASGYASGKTVLDVACGSGYGSGLLAETAAQVIGTDIAREAVDYARRHYDSRQTAFLRADCLSLPFREASFDLVVAFEIIEHIRDAPGFLIELRRVLAPNGLLLVSTPNRLYYTEDRGEVNPFHEKEYSYSEFSELLREAFPHWSILLENHVTGLLLADPNQAQDLQANRPICYQRDVTEEHSGLQKREREAYFLIALCSAAPLPAAPPVFYLPSTGNVLRERETHIHRLEEQIAETRQERDTARNQADQLELQLEERTLWAQDLDRQLAEINAYVLQLQSQYDADVSKARAELSKLQQEFEERTAWALRLDRELQFLQSTRWYRIGLKLGLNLAPGSDSSSESG